MRLLWWAYMLALAVFLALPAWSEEISTDITVNLGGTPAADEDVVEDVAGVATKIGVGTLPAAADVTGYSILPGGDILFSIDIAASLPGGVDVTPRDVVRWNGSHYEIYFEGADHSIPAGAQIDAIGFIEGDLLLLFDITIALGGLTVDDEDLVQLASTSPDDWVLYFDGSAKGVAAGADLDGADRIDSNGHLALSFDISGAVGGVAFDDEDVLEFAPGPDTWTKRYDGSTAHPELAAADVDAVFAPEPGPFALAGAAVLVLVALGTPLRRRSRRTAPLLAMALAALAAAPVFASDGALEINQACVAAGCFAGDDPGYPVTITQPGSYRLTSNLTVATNNATAIRFDVEHVTLDLGGFVLSGPVACTGEPAVCTGESAALEGFGVLASPGHGVVRNGIVRGMGRAGIEAGESMHIDAVVAEGNGVHGIAGEYGSDGWIVENSIARGNGDVGIRLNSGTGAGSVVRNNTIVGNGGVGFLGSALFTGNGVRKNGDYGASGNPRIGGNVFVENKAGSNTAQTNGATELATNFCGSDTTCP